MNEVVKSIKQQLVMLTREELQEIFLFTCNSLDREDLRHGPTGVLGKQALEEVRLLTREMMDGKAMGLTREEHIARMMAKRRTSAG